jgi:hypothetical protein
MCISLSGRIEGELLGELWANRLATTAYRKFGGSGDGEHTSRLVKVGQIREIITGFEHGWIHKWWQGWVVAIL